jgi:hypothetical protein
LKCVAAAAKKPHPSQPGMFVFQHEEEIGWLLHVHADSDDFVHEFLKFIQDVDYRELLTHIWRSGDYPVELLGLNISYKNGGRYTTGEYRYEMQRLLRGVKRLKQ